MKKPELVPIARSIYEDLIDSEIGAVYDATGSIGKRYRRTEEVGVRYAFTVDYQSIEDKTVTIRNIEDNLVKPETNFKSYLFNVCRYIWLNTLRSRKMQSSKQSDLEKLQDLEVETLLNIDESIEIGIYQRNFNKLDKIQFLGVIIFGELQIRYNRRTQMLPGH